MGPVMSNRRAGRRHRAQLFDEHAPVVLAFANLLLGDPRRAFDVAGAVLLREIPRTAPGVPTWITRRAYALAVLAECEDDDRARAAIDLNPDTHLAYSTVGLAIYGGLSYRQMSEDLHLSDSRALQLLREGLNDLGPKQSRRNP